MQIGKIVFGERRVEVNVHHYIHFERPVPPISLEDLAKMFGLNTDISDLPPMSDIDTLHRRNATAIKRSLKLCN